MKIISSLSFVQVVLVAMLGTYVSSGAVNSYASSSRDNVALNGRTESADAHIVSVVAINEVFADGLKVSAVAIQYDKNIRDESLSPTDFTVKTDVSGQKIAKVYTSNDGEKTTKKGLNGPYVILELSTDYVIPVRTPVAIRPPNPGPRPTTPPGPRPEPVKQEMTLNSEVVTQVGSISWEPGLHPATLKASGHGGNGELVAVSQVGEISTTDGITLTATSAAKENIYDRNLIVDGFMKPDFSGANGNAKYNIHFPGDYDPSKKYPVVLFLTDSDSPSGYTHAEALIHGLGAVVWAGKEEEARHEAIVVAPVFPRALIDENDEPAVEQRGPGGKPSTPYLSILALMDDLVGKFPSMDKSRIYLTGQGDGARAAIRMMADRPDLFAAALLFAPDYDPSKIAKLSQARMWIVVSEGDAQSYSSMEGSIASLKTAGARINKGVWSGQANDAQFASDVRSMAAGGRNIEYTVLKKGTVVPTGVSDDAADNHAYTWRIGYSIPALRDWLFTQKK